MSESKKYFICGKKTFDIKFGDLLKNDELKGSYESFDMTSKRLFRTTGYLIEEAYNDLFLKDGEVREEMLYTLHMILNAQYKIMTKPVGEYMAYNEFMQLFDSILSKELIDEVDKYIEKEYIPILDETTANTEFVEKELIVTDSQAKDLLKVGLLQKIMIPVMSSYFAYNGSLYTESPITESQDDEDVDVSAESNTDVMNVDETIVSLFFYIFKKVSTEGMLNKMYRLVESRVRRVGLQAKAFWAGIKAKNVTPESETQKIYRKLIVNTLIKLSPKRNVMSFLQAVMNNSIDNTFKMAFKYDIKSMGLSLPSEGEDLNEHEKLEMAMLRKDEGDYVLRHLNIIEGIARLEEQTGIKPTDTEIDSISKNLNKNEFQQRMVVLFTSKVFDDKTALTNLSHTQYVRIVCILKQFLQKYGFDLLSKLITARPEKLDIKQEVSAKSTGILSRMEESLKYKEAMSAKYSLFSTKISSCIKALVTAFNKNIPCYDENGDNIMTGDVLKKPEIIIEDILNFISVM